MRYFDYFIKCIIRRIVYIFCKPKILLTVLIIGVFLFLYTNSSQAVYTGDDTYTDRNATILASYDTIANDLVNRLSNATSSANVIENYLRNGSYNYYLYYGSSDGSSMINSSTYKTDILYVAIFRASSPSFSQTSYSNYQGMDCNIVSTTPYSIYYFEGNEPNNADNTTVYLPSVLVTYKPQNLVNYLNNSSQEQTDDIVSSIQEQTNTIQEQTNTIKEQTDAMTNTDYDESTVNIDSSSADNVDNSSTTAIFTTLFDNFSNLLNNESWDSVSTITINLPFVDNAQGIELKSDILSSIVGNTLLATFINVFWYSLFGLYAFKFANNIYLSIKSGNILNGLNLNNEVISSTML